jgi:hypothetical protein
MGLDIMKSVAEIQEMYATQNSNQYTRILIFGDVGVGKTKLLETCPQPVHVDSFDPGGTLSIRNKILTPDNPTGTIVADTRYENEDPSNPTALVAWDKTLEERISQGYFDYFSTYCVDSITMVSNAAMNYTLKKKGRKDGIPVMMRGGDNDYVFMQSYMKPLLRKVLNLPCHVILVAHPALDEDDVDKKKFIGPKISGQLQTQLMLMMTEIYCMRTITSKNGLVRSLLTQPDGLYRCRSRLASIGKIEVEEEPNISNILKKAGLQYVDKPIPWLA